MSDNIIKRVGLGTAYGFAKAGGYEGTVEQFTELLGNIAIDLARIENLSVTVTTLPAGSQATASLNGSVLSLGIPKGDKGDKGNTGNTPDFGIGTVTTLSAGSSATASITGTAKNPVLNLGIPQGEAGAGAAGVTASAYSSSSTYAVGDYVIHNSNLYRCTTAITTAEAFTAAHWTQVALADDVSDLKSDLSAVENSLGKENIGNLIMSVISDTIYRYNSGTGVIYTQTNASYKCAVIDVAGLEYVTSTRNFGSTNYQFFGTDTSFVATGASCRTTDAGYVFAVPAGATKLYLSYELSAWNIAVIEGRSDISTKTITDYPVGGTWIFETYNELSAKTETAYDAVKTTTTINTQYLDNSTKEDGYYYSNDVKTANASYSIYAPVTVPAGTYYIGAAASTSFSYVKIGNTFSKLSALNPITLTEYAAYSVTVNAEATFYISVSSASTYKVPISTIPIKPNAEEYRFGDFLECPNKVVYVGSTRHYKTLKSALEAVNDVFDAYIYVDAEEFDLVDEFGQAYLDAYSTAESFGLFLKNRVHLIFASGSKVVFNYTGSNAYVHEYFSPFNAGRYGFELIGANIESTNCRYSVHDEHGTENEPYRNVYKGCTMKHDSTATAWGTHQCIGGGLGLHGTIDIEDCSFNAVGVTNSVDVSYHNPNTSSDAYSRVSVRNSYFNGTFRMSTYGTGNGMTYGYVSNNNVALAPFVSETPDMSNNVTMTAWNNTIRS